jgi:hypothetical protein
MKVSREGLVSVLTLIERATATKAITFGLLMQLLQGSSRWLVGTRTVSKALRCAAEGKMSRHVASVSGDAELRAFYEACGVSPDIIEGALRVRHEKPTNFVGWEKSGEAARVARARRRDSIAHCRPE